MADYSGLIKRLNRLAPFIIGDIVENAVDAIKAQAKEIAELEADIDRDDEWARGFVEKTDARIAELEAALRPFADSRHLDGLPVWTDDGAVIGCNFQLRDLRAARAALNGEK
jgi:hypothetical protein